MWVVKRRALGAEGSGRRQAMLTLYSATAVCRTYRSA